MSEIVYVSWGGTGRSSALRTAVEEAQNTNKTLVYLALLDNDSFSDLDKSMLDLVADELEWVLEAQIEMTTAQVGAPLVPVRLVVRFGDVVVEVTDVAKQFDGPQILVGAPVPVAGHDSVSDLVTALRRATSCEVELIDAG
jgi:hypothetical protein